MDQIFALTGPWFWLVVAGLLLLVEMALPGFFMLWLAVAAALTAIISFIVHPSWTAEIFIFAALSMLTVAASWRFVMNSRHAKSESPHLNQRPHAFVGKTYTLIEPIINGSGKIRVEDALWDVDGEDMVKGARVKVTAVDGMRLVVKKV
jgi:inner membrane protein